MNKIETTAWCLVGENEVPGFLHTSNWELWPYNNWKLSMYFFCTSDSKLISTEKVNPNLIKHAAEFNGLIKVVMRKFCDYNCFYTTYSGKTLTWGMSPFFCLILYWFLSTTPSKISLKSVLNVKPFLFYVLKYVCQQLKVQRIFYLPHSAIWTAYPAFVLVKMDVHIYFFIASPLVLKHCCFDIC